MLDLSARMGIYPRNAPSWVAAGVECCILCRATLMQVLIEIFDQRETRYIPGFRLLENNFLFT